MIDLLPDTLRAIQYYGEALLSQKAHDSWYTQQRLGEEMEGMVGAIVRQARTEWLDRLHWYAMHPTDPEAKRILRAMIWHGGEDPEVLARNGQILAAVVAELRREAP